MAEDRDRVEECAADNKTPPPKRPICKLLEKMRANPKDDWTLENVETLCRQIGLTCSSPSRGSHYKVSSPHSERIVTIPAHRPVKPVFIKDLVKLADLHRSKVS